jgi:hypothetical protein
MDHVFLQVCAAKPFRRKSDIKVTYAIQMDIAAIGRARLPPLSSHVSAYDPRHAGRDRFNPVSDRPRTAFACIKVSYLSLMHVVLSSSCSTKPSQHRFFCRLTA